MIIRSFGRSGHGAFFPAGTAGDGTRYLINSERSGSDGKGGAGGGSAGEDGGSDDVFHCLLDDAAHWASTHLGVVAFFD